MLDKDWLSLLQIGAAGSLSCSAQSKVYAELTFWWIEFSLRALWWIEFSLRALWWISRIRSFWLRMPDYVQYDLRATVHFGGSAGYSCTLFLVQDAKPVPVRRSILLV
jgi:hypothetical protein